ncbi:hypothetical protein, partial [Acidaminobacter sp.]|uniref:hypothetical protein n=1 Tax=Acidaminobacter sp. TaxID=1872102 RepID=UPI0025C63794
MDLQKRTPQPPELLVLLDLSCSLSTFFLLARHHKSETFHLYPQASEEKAALLEFGLLLFIRKNYSGTFVPMLQIHYYPSPQPVNFP